MDDEDGDEDDLNTSDILGLDESRDMMAFDDSDDEDYDETVDSDSGESSDRMGGEHQLDGAVDSEVRHTLPDA